MLAIDFQGIQMDLIRRIFVIFLLSACGAGTAAEARQAESVGSNLGPAEASTASTPVRSMIAARSAVTKSTSTTNPVFYGPPYYWHDLSYGNGGPFNSVGETARAYFQCE